MTDDHAIIGSNSGAKPATSRSPNGARDVARHRRTSQAGRIATARVNSPDLLRVGPRRPMGRGPPVKRPLLGPTHESALQVRAALVHGPRRHAATGGDLVDGGLARRLA